jgi:hypothetical protein
MVFTPAFRDPALISPSLLRTRASKSKMGEGQHECCSHVKITS